jgi:hypothetical protein
MTAHGMAGQIGPPWISTEALFRNVEHFHGIEAAPIFPIETVRPAVGRCNYIQILAMGVAGGLAFRFHPGAVTGKDECRLGLFLYRIGRTRTGIGCGKRRDHREVLHAAVYLADKRPFVLLIGRSDRYRNFSTVQRDPLTLLLSN